MKAIYKYEIPVHNYFSLFLPQGAEVLTVQTQYERPHIWAILDTESPLEGRNFILVGTGHEHESLDEKYIGTFQLNEGTCVFHLFEVTHG